MFFLKTKTNKNHPIHFYHKTRRVFGVFNKFDPVENVFIVSRFFLIQFLVDISLVDVVQPPWLTPLPRYRIEVKAIKKIIFNVCCSFTFRLLVYIIADKKKKIKRLIKHCPVYVRFRRLNLRSAQYGKTPKGVYSR